MSFDRTVASRSRCSVAGLLLGLALGAPSVAMARALPEVDALRSVPSIGERTGTIASKAAVAAMQIDPQHGVPTFLWGADASRAMALQDREPTAKTGLDDEGRARAHLADLATLYRITPTEIAALPLRNRQRLANGSAIVRLAGRVDGIDVFREQANVLLDADGGLRAIGGFVMGAPATAKRTTDAFALALPDAAAVALADYAFPASVRAQLRTAEGTGSYTQLSLATDATSADGSALAAPARGKRVWFRLGDELVPAYYLEVQMRDGAARHQVDYYAYVIAADDGRLLFRHNQTAHAAFSYRAYAESTGANLPLPGPQGRNGFPHPTATPNGYQAPLVAPNLVTLQSAPFSRNDPWLADGATRTIGNNVEAYADLTDPDGFGPADPNECNVALPIVGDLHACANAGNTFDYVYDSNLAPAANRTQVMAAVTNLFYLNNYLHDWFYDAGFDEASGNAQLSNYGRGGLASDSTSRRRRTSRAPTTRAWRRRPMGSGRSCACTCGRVRPRCEGQHACGDRRRQGCRHRGFRTAGVRCHRRPRAGAGLRRRFRADDDRRLLAADQRRRGGRQDRRDRSRRVHVRGQGEERAGGRRRRRAHHEQRRGGISMAGDDPTISIPGRPSPTATRSRRSSPCRPRCRCAWRALPPCNATARSTTR